jgi:pyrroline-5-carboxylate reductase
MASVTAIGIGNMGAALARTLLKAPSAPQLTIWNRTADRPLVKSLITDGAHFEPSITAAIARSQTILICLFDYSTIYSAFAPLSPDTKPLAGKTIINVTNGTPAQARAMESHLKFLGAAAYFDGGIMVTPQLVGTPTAFVVLSGEAEQAYTSLAADLLKPIGAVQYVAEDAGAASLYDVAALAGMYGMFIGSLTGIALLKKQKQRAGQAKEGEKVLAKPATDGVVVPMLNALVPYVSLIADGIDREAWMEDLGNPLAMQFAGVKNIVQTCEEEGVDGSGLRFMVELMEKAVRDGFADGGLAAVGRYMFKKE